MIVAIVPLKALDASKSRLASSLGEETAHRLALAMAGDVLEALGGVPDLARVVAVTADERMAAAAREAGAEALVRPDPGLNATLDAACAELAPGPDDGALVVLGDVAGARRAELVELVTALDAPGVAIAPSNDGGTSALLRIPADIVPAGFGPGSAKVHCDAAAREKAFFRELFLPSLAVDVDTRDDLLGLARLGTPGPRTRALLGELGIAPT